MSPSRGVVSGLFPVVLALLLITSAFAILPLEHVSAQQSGNLRFSSPNSQYNGQFGWSVAVGGNTLVIGAPQEAAGGNGSAGRVYVYGLPEATPTEILSSPNSQSGGWFGYSLALSGDSLVVGAPFEDASGVVGAGKAYVINATTGTLIETLVSPDPEHDGLFGWSVGISGSTAVVGAPNETADGKMGAGMVYAFDDATGTRTAALASPNAQSGGGFGWSVSISDATLVVGAPTEALKGTQPGLAEGMAYMFNLGTGTLTSLSGPLGSFNGQFGYSVSVGGDSVAVGAWGQYGGAGRAYLFNAATGKLVASLASPNSQGGPELFGESVAVNGNGTLVVGAPWENVNGIEAAGRAYAFNGSTGALIDELPNSAPQAGAGLGNSVAAGGTTVAAGEPFWAVGANISAGRTDVFSLSVTVSCNQLSPTVGSPTTCMARVAGSPDGTITWSSSRSGSFSRRTCTLSKGSCSVTYTPESTGFSDLITASYDGSVQSPRSSGSYPLTPVPEATATTLMCAPTSVNVGGTMRCTATVTGYRPAGSVTFFQLSNDGGSFRFSSKAGSCVLSRGKCSATLKGTAAGTVLVWAVYDGDLNNYPSVSNAWTLTIG